MFTGLLNTFFFLSLLRSAPSSTLFTYTTLFRSRAHRKGVRLRPQRRRPHLVPHPDGRCPRDVPTAGSIDRKRTRLNSSHVSISYAVFCLKKKKNNKQDYQTYERDNTTDLNTYDQ